MAKIRKVVKSEAYTGIIPGDIRILTLSCGHTVNFVLRSWNSRHSKKLPLKLTCHKCTEQLTTTGQGG